MPTASGWLSLAVAAVAGAVGHLLGALALYVLSAALVTAVALGVVTVRLRNPVLHATRWVPPVATAGERLTLRLDVSNHSRRSATSVRLSDRLARPGDVETSSRVVIDVDALAGGRQRGYRVAGPLLERGVVAIGPLAAVRTDLLGLAATRRWAAGVDEVTVHPRTVPLAAVRLGHGTLGRALAGRLTHLEPGDLRGLRPWVRGDEPRSVHWPSSARRGTLMVRERDRPTLERWIVLLDLHSPVGPERFETAVGIAASLVVLGEDSGLATRLATSTGLDLRGRGITGAALDMLAEVHPATEPTRGFERDPGEGLGLVMVVTGSPESASWQSTAQVLDPGLLRVGVFVTSGSGAERPSTGHLGVGGHGLDDLAAAWARLVGGAPGPHPEAP